MCEFLAKYASDSPLLLYPQDQEVSENTPRLTLKVKKHLAVGVTRRSQVVSVVLEGGDLCCARRDIRPPVGTCLVAKVFDPEATFFFEWKGSRAEYCSFLSRNEVRAYTSLADMNGIEVPLFYGAYKTGEAFVILLELITQRSLVRYSVQSPEEGDALKAAGQSLIDKLHKRGVYHRDVEPWNLFWDAPAAKLKILDFEMAKFKENEPSQVWEAQDRVSMETILAECGIKCKRKIPEWMKPAS